MLADELIGKLTSNTGCGVNSPCVRCSLRDVSAPRATALRALPALHQPSPGTRACHTPQPLDFSVPDAASFRATCCITPTATRPFVSSIEISLRIHTFFSGSSDLPDSSGCKRDLEVPEADRRILYSFAVSLASTQGPETEDLFAASRRVRQRLQQF